MRAVVLALSIAGALAIACGRDDVAKGTNKTDPGRASGREEHRHEGDGHAPAPEHAGEPDDHGHDEHAEGGRRHSG
jgi:hypothetical protein